MDNFEGNKMSRLNEARYGRMCLLILNICPFTLRHVITDLYRRNGSFSLQDFLEKHKHDLFHLMSRKCCCGSQSRTTLMNRSQWNQLFNKTSSQCDTRNSTDCPCTYMAPSGISPEVFDVTLCCLILKYIFSGTNMLLVDTIRETRNRLIHASNASLDQQTYHGYWTKVTDAIFDLANSVGPQVLEDTQNMVQELEQRVMDASELGERLRILTIDPKRILEFEEQVTVLEDRLEKNDLKFETKKNEESYSKVQLIDDIHHAQSCVKTKDIEESERLHTDLLYVTVAINYLHPRVNEGIDYERFKANCRKYLKNPVDRALTECRDILEELEKQGHIRVGEYDDLKKMVGFNVPLVEEIEDVEKKMGKIHQRKTQTSTVPTRAIVPTHIEDLIVRLDFCDIVPLVNEEYNAVTKNLSRISCQLAMTGYHLIHDSPDMLKEFNKFHDNCKDFNMMIDKSARILRLFYYFDNEDTTGHGKELIKLAENGKEIIKDDPDKFEIFKDKWRRFNELLKQNISFNMWFTEKGATITKQCFGSIVLSLKFDRSENLHSFIDEYKDGVLLQELQRILVTKDFLKSFNLRSAKVNISLEQKEFSPW